MPKTVHNDLLNTFRNMQPTPIRTSLYAALFLTAFMALTSIGFFARINLLIEQERPGTLIAYLGLWGICWFCLMVAAMQPNRIVRWFWAIALSLSIAASQGYYLISGSELGPYDVLSLWQASHELGRAIDQYVPAAIWFSFVFVTSLAGFLLFPSPRHSLWKAHGSKLCWVPVIPVMLICTILLMKEGGGSQGLPQHFAPLAVSGVTLAKSAAQPEQTRTAPTIKPHARPGVRNIVMLVDESVRADYVNLTQGNVFTPMLADRARQILNFGASASGGNCSHYSNALIRLSATRGNIVNSIKQNPTIWQYAKLAGYRTVFIDAQASINKNASRFQNFMTVTEAADIDRIVTFDDIVTPNLDQELMKVVNEELSGPVPVFIYANKNGAHFPYQHGYPEDEVVFDVGEPTQVTVSKEAIIKSYINNIRWNVDRLLSHFLDSADLSETLMLYTSDHGQVLNPGSMTHCSVENPNPREGLVPMLAMTQHPETLRRLKESVPQSWQKTSHFQLVPTILNAMGYASNQVAKVHGASLFDSPQPQGNGFSSGDIFGLFHQEVRWNELALDKAYLEAEAAALVEKSETARLDTK